MLLLPHAPVQLYAMFSWLTLEITFARRSKIVAFELTKERYHLSIAPWDDLYITGCAFEHWIQICVPYLLCPPGVRVVNHFQLLSLTLCLCAESTKHKRAVSSRLETAAGQSSKIATKKGRRKGNTIHRHYKAFTTMQAKQVFPTLRPVRLFKALITSVRWFKILNQSKFYTRTSNKRSTP